MIVYVHILEVRSRGWWLRRWRIVDIRTMSDYELWLCVYLHPSQQKNVQTRKPRPEVTNYCKDKTAPAILHFVCLGYALKSFDYTLFYRLDSNSQIMYPLLTTNFQLLLSVIRIYWWLSSIVVYIVNCLVDYFYPPLLSTVSLNIFIDCWRFEYFSSCSLRSLQSDSLYSCPFTQF